MTYTTRFGEAAKRRLDASIHDTRATLAKKPRHLGAYDALLSAVQRRGTLLARRCLSAPDFHAGLAALALHASDWMHPAQTWSAAEESPWRQFASLAEHLLARFPMPRFMASAWLENADGRSSPAHEWYKRMGRGENIRRMGLPIPVTRAMAHRFLSAPDHLSVTGALRWAQVLSRGGSRELASALIATPLGRELRNEDFWETVILFFVRHCGSSELDVAHVGPIVDFLRVQRFERPAPSCADFSMKGRTPASMLRLVEEWHRALGSSPSSGKTWSRSKLGELAWIERVSIRVGDAVRTESRVWSIRELCSSGELRAEGSDMHHCVGSYVARCLTGQSSIWSMQVETPRGRRRVLTIEVDASARRIRQARGRRNALPKEDASLVLRRWASREGLDVATGIKRGAANLL
jgi:hypothetical protein